MFLCPQTCTHTSLQHRGHNYIWKEPCTQLQVAQPQSLTSFSFFFLVWADLIFYFSNRSTFTPGSLSCQACFHCPLALLEKDLPVYGQILLAAQWAGQCHDLYSWDKSAKLRQCLCHLPGVCLLIIWSVSRLHLLKIGKENTPRANPLVWCWVWKRWQPLRGDLLGQQEGTASPLCNGNILPDGKPLQATASLTPNLISNALCKAFSTPSTRSLMERLPLTWEGCGLSSIIDGWAAGLKGCQQEERLKQSGCGCEISVNATLEKSHPIASSSGSFSCHEKIVRLHMVS